MSEQNREVEAQLFAALQAYESLKASQLVSFNNDTPRLSFSDIVQCARAPHLTNSKSQLAVINSVLDYRRKYRFVLSKLSFLQNPKQAAAASMTGAESSIRQNEHLSLHQLQTDDESVQLSLRVDLEKPKSVTAINLYCEISEMFYHCRFGITEGGEFICSLNKSSHTYQALLNPSSHIYFMWD